MAKETKSRTARYVPRSNYKLISTPNHRQSGGHIAPYRRFGLGHAPTYAPHTGGLSIMERAIGE